MSSQHLKPYMDLANLLDKLNIKSARNYKVHLTFIELQEALTAGLNNTIGNFGVPNQLYMSPLQVESLESVLKSVRFTDKKLKL